MREGTRTPIYPGDGHKGSYGTEATAIKDVLDKGQGKSRISSFDREFGEDVLLEGLRRAH